MAMTAALKDKGGNGRDGAGDEDGGGMVKLVAVVVIRGWIFLLRRSMKLRYGNGFQRHNLDAA
uniref:Uncharacterized protein n=1 Tax=Cucumis melo TaxID=3656 RepID=A0A9I9D6F5_CUCME